MGDYELHADYDRDGRLTASRSEHDLRSKAPGAIVVPNLDIDARALPATAALGSRRTLDGMRPVALAVDDEQLPLVIRVNKASAPAGSRFFLRPLDFPRIRLRFNDDRGHILKRDLARDADLPLAVPTKPGDLKLRVSTHTLPGAPYGHVVDLNPLYSPDGKDESSFRVQLVSVDPAGQETVHDEGRFTIAPFVVLSHDAPATRVYISDDGNNAATLAELEPALRVAKVTFVRVPPLSTDKKTAPVNDTWLQDQFQHAMTQGADGWRQVILHLPRHRADTYAADAQVNLGQFVVTHFPSRNLGLFDDLWERRMHIYDLTDRQHQVPIAECLRLASEMDSVGRLAARLVEQITFIDSSLADAIENEHPSEWTDELLWLPKLLARLERLVKELGGKDPAVLEERQQYLDYYREGYKRVIARMQHLAALRRFVRVPINGGSVNLDVETANQLYRRLNQLRDSSNYGGNIEASPPTSDAPLGKLVIGNVVFTHQKTEERWDFMDPDLLRLLAKQRKQPIVALDTAWLKVGHVDEVMTFVPDRSGSSASFAILQASPAFAMQILQRARDRYLDGLSPDDRRRYNPEPLGHEERLMNQGTSPVTRLMRGKTWLHQHPEVSLEQVPNILEPPNIYQHLSWLMNRTTFRRPTTGGINFSDIRYWPGKGPERHYPADITVKEILFCEQDNLFQSTNEGLATGRLASVDKRLDKEFRGVRRFGLPVIFDRVGNVKSISSRTGGFTPDVVNMLVLGDRLLIPRPYGPRMRLEDATEVLEQAMKAVGMPDTLASRIDARFVRKHGLGKAVYWIERQKEVKRTVDVGRYSGLADERTVYGGLETEEHVIDQFKDSFPDADDEDQLRKLIIEPNKKHFEAKKLRKGALRFVIDDGLVDLFEVSILAVTDELGLTVDWVDSWFYHLRSGEIHCGTNVLRAPAAGARLPKVWSVKNTFQGPHGPEPEEFEFEESEGLKL